MKKFMRLALFSLLCALLLTAVSCAGKTPSTDPEGTSAPAAESTTADLSEQKKYASLSVAALFSVEADGLSPAASGVASSFDRCMQREGFSALRTQKRFGLDGADRTAVNDMIKGGCNVFFASDPSFENIFRELAIEYPDVLFFCENGETTNARNAFYFSSRTYEGFYLAGVAAASESETGRLAFISSEDVPSAQKYAQADAFTLGARAVDPDVTVYLRTVDPAHPPDSLFQRLSSAGCDIFTGNIRAETGVKNAGSLKKRYITYEGADYLSEDAVLGDVSVDFSDFFSSCLRAAADGETAAGNYYGGLEEGAVTFTPDTRQLSGSARVAVNTAAELIKSGRFAVFSGYRLHLGDDGDLHDEILVEADLTDNNGTVLLAAGEDALSAEIVRSRIDFPVDGLNER